MSRHRVLTLTRSGPGRWATAVDDYVSALAWSPDGSRLAVAEAGGPVQVLSGSDGSVSRSLAGHEVGTLALAWSTGGLASAGQDGRIRLWDAEHDRARTLKGGSSWVDRLAWHADGLRLATASGRMVRVWDTAGTTLAAWEAPATVNDIHWGRTRLAAATKGGLELWDVERGRRRRLAWDGVCLRCAWSPTGAWVASGDHEASVHIWNVRTGGDLIAQGYATKVRHLCWDRSGRFLATAGGPHVLVWDCSGNGPAETHAGVLKTEGAVEALAFSPSESVLVAVDREGDILVWDVRRSPRSARRERLGAAATAVAWAPGGRAYVVAGEDGRVVVLELAAQMT